MPEHQPMTEEEILWALVDENELSGALQEHLRTCPQCQAKKAQYEEELVRLGKLAARLSPVPRRPFALQGLASARFGRGQWKSAFRFALAAAGVVLVLWWGGRVFWTPQGGDPNQDMPGFAQVMAEVQSLVEDPLPSWYRDVACPSWGALDDELMDLMVPPLGGESLSSGQGRKG